MQLVDEISGYLETAYLHWQQECALVGDQFAQSLREWLARMIPRLPNVDWRREWQAFVDEWQLRGVDVEDAQQLFAFLSEVGTTQPVHAENGAPAAGSATDLLPANRAEDADSPDSVPPTPAQDSQNQPSLGPENNPSDVTFYSRLIDRLRKLRRESPWFYINYDELADAIVPPDERQPPKDKAQWGAYLAKLRFLQEIAALKQQQDADMKAANDQKWSDILHDIRTHKPVNRLASDLKLSQEWKGDAYFWVFTDDRGTFAQMQIAERNGDHIDVLQEFGGYVLENGSWRKEGERTLSAECNGFVTYILSPLNEAITPDELRLLVGEYFRSGGRGPIQKAIEEEQERRDKNGYIGPAPGTPEYSALQSRLSAEESERFIEFMVKQGHSRAVAQLMLFLLPASINPSQANFDNIVMALGATAVAVRGTQQLGSWQGAFSTDPGRAPLLGTPGRVSAIDISRNVAGKSFADKVIAMRELLQEAAKAGTGFRHVEYVGENAEVVFVGQGKGVKNVVVISRDGSVTRMTIDGIESVGGQFPKMVRIKPGTGDPEVIE